MKVRNLPSQKPYKYTPLRSDVANVLTMAVEGPALTEWTEIKAVRRDKRGDVSGFMMRSKADKSPHYDWVQINRDAITGAAFKLLTKPGMADRSIGAQFVGEWDADMYGVDSLVQIACFGEVVYQ